MSTQYIQYPASGVNQVGSPANGLSISGSTISLGLASTSTTGALSSTDWNTFNSKQTALTLGNLTDAGTDGITITGGTGSVIGSGTSLSQHVADSTHNGYLSSTDWSIFNGKGSGTVTSVAMTVPSFLSIAGSPITTSGTLGLTLSGTALPVANGGTGVTSLGNLTDVGTDGITVTGGTGCLITSASIAQQVADATHNGYLSSTDWNTFNNKGAGTVTSVAMTVPAFLSISGSPITTSGTLGLTLSGTALPTVNGGTGVTSLGNLTDVGTDGITVTGGTGCLITSASIAQHVADSTHNGYLSSTDWTTFNGKGTGSVTSVTFTGDGTVLSSTPSSAVTTSGTVSASLNTQAIHTFLAGPVTGANAAPTFRALAASDMIITKNMLLNGGFDFWQRGTSGTIATGTNAYTADRWNVNNASGSTASWAQGNPDFNLTPLKVTFGASATSNNLFVYQYLTNTMSYPAYNQTVKFSAQFIAAGLGNQITVAVGYNTSEAQGFTSIATAVFAINTSTDTLASVTATIGTNPTTAGILVVRAQLTGASSGNVYASGNGFFMQNAMLNVGSTAAPFSRASGTYQGEELACLAFYEKSFPLTTVPAAGGGIQTYTSGVVARYNSTTSAIGSEVRFKVIKRATPTLTYYDPTSGGTTGKASYYDLNGNIGSAQPISAFNGVSTTNFWNYFASGLATGTIGQSIFMMFDWVADAEIY